MGPKDRAVTAKTGEVYGCDGLYVMDAAAFPGPVGANPSATIAAVAEYKVARFLESCPGVGPEKIAELEAKRQEASAWVDAQGRDRLDPLGPNSPFGPGPQSVEPAHRPVGIEFEETMVGAIDDLGTRSRNNAHGQDRRPSAVSRPSRPGLQCERAHRIGHAHDWETSR